MVLTLLLTTFSTFITTSTTLELGTSLQGGSTQTFYESDFIDNNQQVELVISHKSRCNEPHKR
jgi:hypothetical protein